MSLLGLLVIVVLYSIIMVTPFCVAVYNKKKKQKHVKFRLFAPPLDDEYEAEMAERAAILDDITHPQDSKHRW